MITKKFNKKKIILGTVNFGVPYGIVKKKIQNKQVFEIINYAIKNGVRKFDTAQSYGMSEVLLGYVKKKIEITTKIMPDIHWTNINCFNQKIGTSFSNLKKKKIDTILFHNISVLKKNYGKVIYNHLIHLKKKKIIKKIGVSIYNYSDLNFVLKKFKIDIVQCPFNIFDRRLVEDGHLTVLKKKKIEVHVRSVFLQGLLVNKSFSSNKYFKKWKNQINTWFDYLLKNNISSIQACISYVLNFDIDKIIIGVRNLNEFKQILKIKQLKEIKFFKKIDDLRLIDPRFWKV